MDSETVQTSMASRSNRITRRRSERYNIGRQSGALARRSLGHFLYSIRLFCCSLFFHTEFFVCFFLSISFRCMCDAI